MYELAYSFSDFENYTDDRQKIETLEKSVNQKVEVALDPDNSEDGRKILKIKRSSDIDATKQSFTMADNESTVPTQVNQFKLVNELPKFKFNFKKNDDEKKEESKGELKEFTFKPM